MGARRGKNKYPGKKGPCTPAILGNFATAVCAALLFVMEIRRPENGQVRVPTPI